VLRGHSGLEALGGGSFEEVVRPPLGNCSINTYIAQAQAGSRGVLPDTVSGGVLRANGRGFGPTVDRLSPLRCV
jgi:hypothetical protein